MLAYQIIQYLACCWSTLDCTVEEGLHALATLCLVEVVANECSQLSLHPHAS